jgi:RHS repeat-associated protein
MLDDSGLIHMNGRLYDAELGRMLGPDPYVQVPEYSQNFNRYSYVLNNPLNKTDPTGYSWLSKAFHKIGSWFKENWRTVVSIALGAILMFTPGGQAFLGAVFSGVVAGVGGTIVGMSYAAFQVGMAAVAGGIMGAANAAMAGGDLGDVLRGAVVGAITGAITTGILNDTPNYLARVAGHGVLGGTQNAAMGGKFQDGFLGASVGHAFPSFQLGSNPFMKSVSSAIIGGTASKLGGGKFANGAFSAAFSRLFADLTSNQQIIERDSIQGKWFYPNNDPELALGVEGHGITGDHPDSYYQKWATKYNVAVFHVYSEGGFGGAIQDIGEVMVEKFLGGFGSRVTSEFIRGYEKLPVHARMNISTHSQGVSPIVAAMFRRPDLFQGVHLDARSSSVYAARVWLATKYSGSSYNWSMPTGPDIANVYASMNPLKIVHALVMPKTSIRNHSFHSVDSQRGINP